MNSELKHIFDKSACLSRRQLKDYIGGHMASEECHAVEHHLNDCPLCSAAVDGMLLNQEKNLEAVSALNTDFLKEHFGLNNPEVHLNSITAASQVVDTPRARSNVQPFWRNVSIAAAVILGFGLIWYIKSGAGNAGNTLVAQKLETDKPAVEVAQNAPKQAEPAPAENTLALNEQKAAAEPAVEAEQQTASNNAAAGAAAPVAKTTADEVAVSRKDKMEAAKVDDTKNAALAAADKKTQADKAKALKVAADAKKTDPKAVAAMAKPAVPAKTAAAKESPHTVAQAPANREEFANKAADQAAAHAGAAPAVQAAPQVQSVGSSASSAGSAETLPSDKLDLGKYYYDKQKYNQAIQEYKNEINNSSKSRRHRASYMAAQCYVKLGNTKEAERLLKIVVDEGGPEKRQAKKLLESINKSSDTEKK